MTQAQTASDDYPLVGLTIANKYKIVRLLGEGGMGCVYQGEQILGTTTRKVAVKTLHKHLSHDESIKQRFQREVGTVAALEHPNTIQVFDFGEMDDGTLYIVMEFVQGRSVADILEKDGPMPPQRVELIMKQVTGSLEEAHNHGIVHRDLKPDNVVLCERAGQKDWVEVLDFGIAKRSTEHDPNEAKLTQQGMVLGTPPYMSPEQFTGQPVDLRSDIYALGVMSYEMLSGKLPWEANTAWEWASKHMTEMPTPLERQPLGQNVPEPMRNAIARALSKDKNDRFASVREYFDAFSGGAVPQSVTAANNQIGGGTSVIGASATSGPVSARAKTEMGTPMPIMSPQSSVSPTNPGMYSQPGVPPVSSHIPQPPQASGGGEKKSPMLVIVLGGLAVLLLVGAGVTALVSGSKTKTTAAVSVDLNGTSSAAPTTIASENVNPAAVASATPLDPNGAKAANNVPNTSSGGAHTTPKPDPKPIPTPHPVKEDPVSCARAREAKAKRQPQGIIVALETQCRKEGGTP